MERDRAWQLVDADREQRRANGDRDHVFERPAIVLGRPVHVERRTFAQQWREEREALHVVPMQVGQQAVTPEQFVDRDALAVVAKARAHVEQQRCLPRRVDRHARRVAAVPTDVIALARRRAADSMERDAHHRVIPKTWHVTRRSSSGKVQST